MKKGKSSIQKKLVLMFGVIIAVIMGIAMLLHIRSMKNMRTLVYENMQAQAEYYQENLDREIDNILKLQIDFFTNQKLIFLTEENALQSDYERREALLSVRERIGTIADYGTLVKDAVLYIPDAGYRVTAGAIRKMTREDQAAAEEYMKNASETSMNYDGENFYVMRSRKLGGDQDFIFVITFSTRQLVENLSMLSTSPQSGAFIYNREEDILIESPPGQCGGREILGQLETDTQEDYLPIQRVGTAGTHYLVCVGNSNNLGLFVQYVEEKTIMEYSRKTWISMFIFLALMIAMSAMFVLYTKKTVHKPMQQLVSAFEKVKVGNLKEHISHKENDEFDYLYEGFNDMEDKLSQLIQEVYVQKNLAEKAQLKQLQAQINPHFLYNSFFILSRRIKRQDYENAEDFAKHLGNYFRFLTRNGSDDTTLERESEHARSYAAIQGVRFAGRLTIEFGELLPDWKEVKVPRLILQPLLENSFEHGLENRVSDGLLRISFTPVGQGLEICVEDNGEDVKEEDLQRMQAKLRDSDSEEITGLSNIHKRLNYYFHGKAGLVIERSPLGGAAVKIKIEGAGESDESESVDRG